MAKLDGCNGGRGEQEETARVQWEPAKAEALVEGCCARVFGIDNDGKHRERLACAKNSANRVRQQQFADALATDPLVPRQSPDQRGRNGVVPWQLARDLVRQVLEAERERTQAVEADDTQGIIRCDEHPRHVASLILTRPMAKPVIEIGLPTSKGRPVMMFAERLDDDAHRLSR